MTTPSSASIESISRLSADWNANATVFAHRCSRFASAPLRLAIYYGYPSLVNKARGDAARAVASFADYDIVVLGDGLEVDGVQGARGAGREEHAFTIRLIDRLQVVGRAPEVLGYIDLGRTQHLTLREITGRLAAWARMGAAGVLLDEAGYDFGVTRERQNAAVETAHAFGLAVCLNAFDPNDVFSTTPVPLNEAGGGNPRGLAPVISARDAVLIESFAFRHSTAENFELLRARTGSALAGRARFGTRVLAISTGARCDGDANRAHHGWWTAAVLGLDAYGWGEPAYSAATSMLPWVPRPIAERTLGRAAYVEEPAFREHTWNRRTTLGTIVVDTMRYQGHLDQR
jgi:hypothetical protein